MVAVISSNKLLEELRNKLSLFVSSMKLFKILLSVPY